MGASRGPLYLLLTLAIAGCEDQLAVTDHSPNADPPQLAQGGIPGPPPQVIVPTPPGLSRVPRPLPPGAGPPSFLTNIVDVDAGNRISCALRSDGLAYCWGAGILGDGSSVGSSVPVEVSGPNRFVRIEVGDLNTCGLTSAGEAWCWGDNSQGQLGAGSAAAFALVPVAVAGGHQFTDLDVGLRNACGVAIDGVTYCWGSNANGQLGNGTPGGPLSTANAPVAVQNSAALRFASVQVGYFNTCGLTGGGQLYCWGREFGFGNGSTSSTVVPAPTLAAGGAAFASMALGILYSCGFDGSGSASCWGGQVSGELGTGSTTTPAPSPALVVGGLTFTALDASDNNSVIASTCGVSGSGAAWCWGSNALGQLGGSSSDTCTFGGSTFPCSATPVPVNGGLTFRDIAVGREHACGLDLAGNVWCWGGNTGGELGDGTMVNSAVPVQVAGLTVAQQDGWIEITPTSALLQLIGTTQQYTAVALDENGAPRPVQPTFAWSSSDPNVATVDATGLATAVASGAVTITATAPDGSSARVTLSVQIVDPVALWLDAWAGGSSAGAGGSDGMVVLGGLLADEWVHSGTFPTRSEVDRRSISNANATVDEAFRRLAFARIALEHDAARLAAANPADPMIGELLTLAGYVYLAFAENFCSGVPLDDPNTGESTGSLLSKAFLTFRQAVQGPIPPQFVNAANVGMGRSFMDAGFRQAHPAVLTVPTGYTLTTSQLAISGQQNVVWALNAQQKRLSLADMEGSNGLNFRSAVDPRVASFAAGSGFDGITPAYTLTKYPDAAASILIASGTEARLLEAEGALGSGDVAGMLNQLNALRAAATPPLPLLTDPGTYAGRVDLLFAERAFWLFADGHRLGDLRRRKQYWSAVSGPAGPYPKGGTYGTDLNLPVPNSARGPSYADCTDRVH